MPPDPTLLLQNQKIYVDTREIPVNKPVHLKSGAHIALEDWQRTYKLICETAGTVLNHLLGNVSCSNYNPHSPEK